MLPSRGSLQNLSVPQSLSDPADNQLVKASVKKELLSPEETSNWFLSTSLFYLLPLIRFLFKHSTDLTLDDLPPLPSYLEPTVSADNFKAILAKVDRTKPKTFRLALLKFISKDFIKTFILSLIAVILNIALPILSGIVVQAVKGELTTTQTSLLIVAIFLSCFWGSALMQFAYITQTRSTIKAWGALTTLVLEHPAQMTVAEKSRFNEGEVLGLLTSDCQAVNDVMLFLGLYLMMPVQALFVIVLLFYYLGLPFFVGLVILILNTYIGERCGDEIKKMQGEKNKCADERGLLLNESLQGIRTIKLYSWEIFAISRVLETRSREVDKLRSMGTLRALQTFMALGVPIVAMVATFVVYQYVNQELDADVIFISAGLFEFLNMALAIIPNALNELRRMLVSINRIGRFVYSPATYKQEKHEGTGSVSVKDATFIWENFEKISLTKPKKEKKKINQKQIAKAKISISKVDIEMKSQLATMEYQFALKNVNIKVPQGKFIAIVGRVGSGKSTLIDGILGLMNVPKGKVELAGRGAYVPQQAFVMNDTFRNNILFGSEFDEEKYQKVIKSCSLNLDIGMLPAGDESEVGEKGITISGGQKQRVAIARAAYAQPDIVLLDDPLSAMDAHIGRDVFENCILNGPLGKSTRIMVTNQLQYCEKCDEIYVLVDGEIVEHGTHEDLMKLKNEYYQLAVHVVGKQSDSKDNNKTGKEEEEEEEKEKEEQEKEKEKEKEKEQEISSVQEEKKNINNSNKNNEGEGDKKQSGTLISVEKKKSGRIGVKTFLRLASAAKSYFLGYCVLILILLCPVLQYLVNLFLASWSDNQNSSDSIYFWRYIGTAILFSISAGVRSTVFNVFFVRASHNLHNTMLLSVLKSPMSFFDTTPIGRILNRFSGDIMQLDLRLPRLFEMWAYVTGMSIVIIVVGGVIVPPMIIGSVILIIVIVVLYVYIGHIILDLRRILSISYSPIMAFFSGYIVGLDSIRAFGRVDLFFEKFRKIQKGPINALYYMTAIQTFGNIIVLATSVALFMSLLSLALILLRHTSWVTPAYAGLILSYCSLLAIRFPTVFFMTSTLEQVMSGAQRIVEYIKLDSEGIVHLKDGSIKPTIKPQIDWPSQGKIEMKEVVMSYRSGLPAVLKGVTVTIQPGEKVGVVGRTGAGKSSLILALFRMVELTSGVIELDGIDISSVSLDTLRSRLGMIPQDPFLFSGTIRSNLDVFNKHTDDEIWQALGMVNLEKTVRGYPKGLLHEVKEKGENFSVGMVQLFCLARVLLKHPKVIFMDEATASVDLETDSMVQETIRKSFSSCTIVTIAHRLNTIIDYDKVLVMDAGRAAEFGSPAELLTNTNSLFYNLIAQTGKKSANELRQRAIQKQSLRQQ